MVSGSNRRRLRGSIRWIPAALALGMTLWAYWPALDAGFVFDDEPNIVDSPAVHWTEVSGENLGLLLGSSRLSRRPVANLSFAADHLTNGLDPRGFHLTNLLIHLAVGGALIWLSLLYVRVAQPSSRTKTHAAAVLVPVLVFMVHPLNTQAVTYVVQRMTSLATLFSLLAFGAYLMARHKVARRWGWSFGAAVGLWGLGLGSKENAVLLLPVVVLYEGCFFHAQWRGWKASLWGRVRLRRLVLGVGVASVAVLGAAGWYLVVSSDAVSWSTDFGSRAFTGMERVLTQSRVQLLYVSLLLWPSPQRLTLDHDFTVSHGLLDPPSTLIATWVWVIVLASSIFLAVRRPRYGFPLLAYAAFHAIEAGPLDLELVFEHRMYLPGTMLVLLGAALLADAKQRHRVATGVLLIILAIPLAGWTHARNLVWANPIELQRDIARKAPNKARTQHNFAAALLEGGLPEEALPVIQRAITLDSGNVRPRLLLGDVLLELERPGEAIDVYRAASVRAPGTLRPVLGIGHALVALQREDEAFRHFVDTGTGFGMAGMAWEAIPLLREAVAIRKESAEAHRVLGSALLTAGLNEGAFEEYRRAVQLDPANVEAWYNAGAAADALGLWDEAIRAYRGFVERAPASLQEAIARARARITELESIG